MINYTEILFEKALIHCEKLSKHIVLEKYWDCLSLVLKGSVARMKADEYSDIDFVFYCDEGTREEIVTAYKKHGLSNRQDNIFQFLDQWEGHYHLETFEEFESYFDQSDFPQIWEFSTSKILHDPNHRLENLRKEKLELFEINVEGAIKNKYLETQLQLDWLRHPLIRGDEIASVLHSQQVIRNILQLAFLIEEKAYPHDKWIGQYLEETEFGKIYHAEIKDYVRNILDETGLEKGKPLECYAQYTIPEKFLKDLGKEIQEKFGKRLWVEEWYFYV